MTATPRRTTATGASVYEDRPDCPARFHDSYSATRRAGCVCPEAREQRRLYIKRWQVGTMPSAYVDPTGTRRRLQALSAIGWPLRELVRQLGWKGTPGRLMWGGGSVHRSTAAAVSDLYNRLWDKPGPSNKARAAARRAGYVPPMAWDDSVIDDPAASPSLGETTDSGVDAVLVERALAGKVRWGQINQAERVEVMRRRGSRSWSDLSATLGASHTTIRAAAGIADNR